MGAVLKIDSAVQPQGILITSLISTTTITITIIIVLVNIPMIKTPRDSPEDGITVTFHLTSFLYVHHKENTETAKNQL